MNNNQIDLSAKIHPNIKFGAFNRVGKNVIIEIIGNNLNTVAEFGDNNIINDNTRIFINGSLKVGDWNVFHNDMLLMVEDHIKIGHNCWFGQNTILDGAGGLEIGNGVRIGMYSQVWTHVASGEQIEGCTLFAKRKTIIHDDVWLVGSCVVGSGIELGKRSTALINSIITKDTQPNCVYAGSPAKLMENTNFYQSKTLDEKFDMLKLWIQEFVENNSNNFTFNSNQKEIILQNNINKEKVVFTISEEKSNDVSKSIFYLFDKTFNKTNNELERIVYKFLYNNKARFLPF